MLGFVCLTKDQDLDLRQTDGPGIPLLAGEITRKQAYRGQKPIGSIAKSIFQSIGYDTPFAVFRCAFEQRNLMTEQRN